MSGRLIIVCGLPGAGKTTLARKMETELRGIRLSPDEWMAALKINFWESEKRDEIEALQWDLAQTWLARGFTVIIEWGTWAREERDMLRLRARELGAGVELHYLTAAEDMLFARVDSRPAHEFPRITRAQMSEFTAMFQAPDADELALFDVSTP